LNLFKLWLIFWPYKSWLSTSTNPRFYWCKSCVRLLLRCFPDAFQRPFIDIPFASGE